MRELLTAASPYRIVKSNGGHKIEYCGFFKENEKMKETLAIRESKELMDKFFVLEESEDSLQVIIDTQYWEYCGN